MKINSRLQRITVGILAATLIVLAGNYCKKDDDDENTEQRVATLDGEWQFTITPDTSALDTTTINGLTASDFEEHATIVEEVYLYEDNAGNIEGFSGPIRLTGKRNGNDINLNVFIDPDGEYEPSRPISEMLLFSVINGELDEFGFIHGYGRYEDYPEYPNIINNTYTLDARKITSITKSEMIANINKSTQEINHWYDFICDGLATIAGWVISDLTDGTIRPMSRDCWLHKDGGGYYMFGHSGPGSIFPIFTTSLYYPYEWCRCATRAYGFTVSLKGESLSYLALKNSILGTTINDIFAKLGFPGNNELFLAMDDFHNKFGGFGMSMFWDTHTDHIGLFVNHKSGSSEEAKNHILTQSIAAALSGFASKVYIYAGESIHTDWHLKRSAYFSCNSPMIISYLIGTYNVNYD